MASYTWWGGFMLFLVGSCRGSCLPSTEFVVITSSTLKIAAGTSDNWTPTPSQIITHSFPCHEHRMRLFFFTKRLDVRFRFTMAASSTQQQSVVCNGLQELDITEQHQVAALYYHEYQTSEGRNPQHNSFTGLSLSRSSCSEETVGEKRQALQQNPASLLFTDSPKTILYEPSEYDIELEELHVPLPPPAMTSADCLVLPPRRSPSPHQSAGSSAASFVTRTASETEKKTAPEPEERPRIPDYKQTSLRWPYMVFIFTLIAGLFAFIEYEINDLPPPHYSMIAFDELRPDKAIPDPRPPEGNYPKPPSATSTYCGWSAPKWELRQWNPSSCDDLLCDDWDQVAWCKPQTIGGQRIFCLKTKLSEMIDTFTTDDPSWCPCEGDFYNGDFYRDTWDSRAGSHDPGCQSAMSAILSFNSYKTKYRWLTTTNYHYSETLTAVPESPKSGFWAYPKTNSDGAILMPLVVRTAGPESQDAFGNAVEPSETALFPDGFAGQYRTGDSGHNVGYNPCSMLNMFSGVIGRFDGWQCPEAQVGVFSTVWWTLPLTRPTSSTSTTADSPTETPVITTTNAASSEGVTTSTAEVASSATVPVCTSCSPESLTQPSTVMILPGDGATSTSTSAPLASSASSASTTTLVSTPSSTSQSTSSSPSGQFSTVIIKLPIGDDPASSTTITQIRTLSFQDTTAQQSTTSSSDSPTTAPPVLPIGVGSPTSTQPSTIKSSDRTPVSRPDVAVNPIIASSPPPGQSDTRTQTRAQSPNQIPNQITSQMQNSISQSDVVIPTGTSVHPAQDLSPERASEIHHLRTKTLSPSEMTPVNPTVTPGGPIDPSSHAKFFNLRSETDYLMASVVPVLLATLLAIPIQVFITSINSMLPFRALSHYPGGATAQNSLLLSRNPSFHSPLVIGVRLLHQFLDPLPLLGFFLGTLSTVLIPISSEVIRLEYTKECTATDEELNIHINPLTGLQLCAFGLRKSGPLMRATEGLLIGMALLTIAIAYLLVRWRTGVLPEPWSIASMATLLSARGSGLASLLREIPSEASYSGKGKERSVNRHIKEALSDKRFRLGFMFPSQHTSYGIKSTEIPIKEDDSPITPTTRDPRNRKPQTGCSRWNTLWQKMSMSGTTQDLTLRIVTFIFKIGLLVLILYYELTVAPDTEFERFMNSQGFGVRILFTAFGSGISAFWGYYFLYTSESQIHTRLASSINTGGLAPESSILLSPPSNPFFAVYLSIKTMVSRISIFRRFRRGNNVGDLDPMSFNIALATILSKFTPILLSNIPYNNAVTWKIHEACTWLSVAFLGYTAIILGCTFVPAGFVSTLLGRTGRVQRQQIAGRPAMEQHVRGIIPLAGDTKTQDGSDLREMTSRGQREEQQFGEGSRHAQAHPPAEEQEVAVSERPVKLDTIAGVMYYLCESKMLKDFEQTFGTKQPVTNKCERDRTVADMGRRYTFGNITGSVTGQKRLGVDYIPLDNDRGSTAQTSRSGADTRADAKVAGNMAV
ncbi:hypothetical protein V8F33_002625 [Rhypophila sp. PSN 637]